MNFEAHPRSAPTASNEHMPAEPGIFERVANEISQHDIQQNGIAPDRDTGWMHAQRETLAVGHFLMVAADARK